MKSVVINDLHVPFEDKTAVKLVLSYIKREKPEIVILDGDIADFYKISHYDKDPCRLETLQDELDLVVKFLRELRKASGTAKIIYIQGNHEDRLRRYLWNIGKDISSLRCLKLNQLLEFKELGIQYCEKGYRLGKLYITHGGVVRKHSGYSAKAEYDRYGCSGISGHTHRDGKYTIRHMSGHFAWWENYCLCDLEPAYIEGIANWTQGFSVVTTIGNRQYVEQIPIINGTYIYGGKLYGLQ